jgi:membrane-associated phospholipid phosphatase
MLRKCLLDHKAIRGALLVFVVGFSVLPWDLEVSQFAQSFRLPGDLRKAIHLSETFGHSLGAIAILGTLLCVDRSRWQGLLRVAIFTAICGTAANAAKFIIPRYRPHALEDLPNEIVSAWETWGTPFTGSWFEEGMRSFPSGHSATAVAMGIGLTQLYPRGRWCFTALAALACLQRLIASAHFVSDIMGGILISLLISVWFWPPTVDQGVLQNPCEKPLFNGPSLVETPLPRSE